MSLTDRLQALDHRQQSGRWTSFIAAVIKKFGDDQGGQLAALISYYGFVSLFPLLLVFVTILGFVLQGNESAQASVLHSTLGQFPVIGNQLQQNIGSLKGSGVSLAIGVVGSLLGGPRRHGATQNAFNQVWYVPHKRRPNFITCAPAWDRRCSACSACCSSSRRWPRRLRRRGRRRRVAGSGRRASWSP